MTNTPTRTRLTYKDTLRGTKVRKSQDKLHETKQRKLTLTPISNRLKNKETTHSKSYKTGVKTRSQPTHTTVQKKQRIEEIDQDDTSGTSKMEIDGISEEDIRNTKKIKDPIKSKKRRMK